MMLTFVFAKLLCMLISKENFSWPYMYSRYFLVYWSVPLVLSLSLCLLDMLAFPRLSYMSSNVTTIAQCPWTMLLRCLTGSASHIANLIFFFFGKVFFWLTVHFLSAFFFDGCSVFSLFGFTLCSFSSCPREAVAFRKKLCFSYLLCFRLAAKFEVS